MVITLMVSMLINLFPLTFKHAQVLREPGIELV